MGVGKYIGNVEERVLSSVWMRMEEESRWKRRRNIKYEGLEICVSGRLGKKKLGRKTKYKVCWGELGRGSVGYPSQYGSGQIQTKLGSIGLKVFMR